MNDPDPFLQSLTDEARDLPLQAAHAARQRVAQRQRHRRRLALAALTGVTCLIGLFAGRAAFTTPEKPLAAAQPPSAPAPRVVPAALREEKSAPLPSGLDAEQLRFVTAAHDVPLLLVRDATGKVTRIHVVER
jgi:hypothetical protein